MYRLQILDKNGQILGFFFTGSCDLTIEGLTSTNGEWVPSGGITLTLENLREAGIVIGDVKLVQDKG
jgi:hypothetical protein